MTNTAASTSSGTFAPLHVPAFRSLWIVNTGFSVGVHLHATAAVWLMLEMTGSATWVALLAASVFIPRFTFALIAGAAADVVGRVRVMILAHVVAALAAMSLAVLGFTDNLTPGLLLSLGLVLGAAFAFRHPAWFAIIPDLVPERLVPQAMSLLAASATVGLIAGPVFGGVLIAASEPTIAFAINAGSLLGMSLAVFIMRERIRSPVDPDARRVRSAIASGLRFARHAPLFRRLLLVVAVFGFVSAHLQALLPSRTVELAAGPTTYGLLLGAFGVGALTGSLTRQVATDALGRSVIQIGLVMFGLGAATVGAVDHVAAVTVALVVAGTGWTWTIVTVWSMVQVLAPHWVRGRAISILALAQMGLLAIGGTSAGALADRFGAGRIGVVFGLATFFVVALVRRFRIPAVAEIDAPRFTDQVEMLDGSCIEGGPILVFNTWRVRDRDFAEFVALMDRLRGVRLRAGAIGWDLYRDSSNPHRLTEIVRFASWDDHIAMHRRLDDRSRSLLRTLGELDLEHSPFSWHLVSVDPKMPADWQRLIDAHETFHATDGSVPLAENDRPAPV